VSLLPDRFADQIAGHMAGQQVCVTGGAGFIGGHLVDALIALGAFVTVIDDLSNASARSVAQAMDRAPDRIRFIQASILDPEAMNLAVEGARNVFHLAALGSVPMSIQDPVRNWVVNATGSMRVLQAAKAARVQRVIHSASSSAYGNHPELPKCESMAPRPESPYAAAKYAGESLMRAWAACYEIDTISLRYFNIFGPRQATDSAYAAVIPALVTRYLTGQSPIIYGSGEQTRDFTHVSNAVAANLLAAVAQEPLKGQVVNVGAGVQTSINELATMIAEILRMTEIKVQYEPERVGEVFHSVSCIDLAKTVIGYEPTTSIEAGLEQTIRWYADEHKKQASSQSEAS